MSINIKVVSLFLAQRYMINYRLKNRQRESAKLKRTECYTKNNINKSQIKTRV